MSLFWGNICVWASGLLGRDTFLSFSVSVVPSGSNRSRPPQTRSPFFSCVLRAGSALNRDGACFVALNMASLFSLFIFLLLNPYRPQVYWHFVSIMFAYFFFFYIFPTYICNPLLNKIKCNLHALMETIRVSKPVDLLPSNEKVSRFG